MAIYWTRLRLVAVILAQKTPRVHRRSKTRPAALRWGLPIPSDVLSSWTTERVGADMWAQAGFVGLDGSGMAGYQRRTAVVGSH